MSRLRRLAARLAPPGDEAWLQHIPAGDRVVVARAMRVIDRVGGYFRYEVRGCEHVPATGGALIVTPHTAVTIDGLLLGAEILRRRGRQVRALGDHQLMELPGVGGFLTRLGAVDGHPDNAMKILRDGELCFVMPGGAREAWQPPIALEHPPEAADDPAVVRALHTRVRDTVAGMLTGGYRGYPLFRGRS